PTSDSHGNEVTERVGQVVYTTKTPLPDGQRDTFELSLSLPEAEGETLAFPTIQTCRQGRTAWTEIAPEGQSGEDLESPAPLVTITGSEGTGSGDGSHGHGSADAAAAEGGAEASSDGAGDESSDGS